MTIFPISLSSPRLVALATLLSVSATVPVQAGSYEKVAPTADDLARELGIEMTKFAAKFEEPVYCTAKLAWKEKGQKEGLELQASSETALKQHEILFTRKDLGLLQERTGSGTTRMARGLLDLSASVSGAGFVYRVRNPFAELGEGMSLWANTRTQSFEDVPLDEPITVFVMTGPWDAEAVKKATAEDYHSAPAYIRLELVFSKTRPVAPEQSGAEPKAGDAKAEAPAKKEP